MYGLMLTIFILCIIYFAGSILFWTCAFLQASTGDPYKYTIPWPHLFSLAIVICATIASCLYLFGNCR